MITPQRVGAALGRVLESGFQIAVRPDHPLLLSAPSLLIGGAGRLTAVFLVGRSSDRALLYARIVSSRLALPSYTRMVALVDEGADRGLNGLMRNFDLVASAQEPLRVLGRYCGSDELTGANQNDLLQAKRSHQIRYSTALQISNFRHRHELFRQSPADVIGALRAAGLIAAAGSRATSKVASYNEMDASVTQVIGVERQSNASSRAALLKFWTAAQNGRFVLDAGVPYTLVPDVLDLLLVEDWPSGRFDPEKPVRAAAFGGFITAMASPVEQITKLIDRARTIMRKRLRERT